MVRKKSNETIMKERNIKDRSLSFAPESENEIFGQFILQTNEVQTTLAITVLLHSSLRDKKYNESLIERTLGNLIFMFQACMKKTSETQKLLSMLKNYKTSRNKIAHKMYLSEKRLNQKDAEQAMKTGKDILKILNTLIDKKGLRKNLLKLGVYLNKQ
ncbi:hypothetical protein A2906_02955 [Candidatus Nomurabacteria bacterium RIFCSPLOWO2_01_FULL_37_25]|nr:MAG: hypothetical protein A2640_01610 [Candidatus Nomurabacteria bacterium RIFCSPHIGHO2_01_FULL_36_23]OGI88014.1 MAG: hypothetical protein A2906_02955 [Candidatus Nomurabacteria bacterium RIFCSPLOWO2_01_FULL_37_25]